MSGPLERAGQAVLENWLGALRRGRLDLRRPDGSVRRFGGEGPADAALLVDRPAFYRRVLLGGDIGFGEAFQAGDFRSPDLVALIRLFIDNAEALSGERSGLAALGQTAARLGHALRRNTFGGSRRNIRAHYDLGNEFFESFLDPTMLYSCAVYAPGDDLEAAQRRKVAMLLDKARVGRGRACWRSARGGGSWPCRRPAAARA